MNLTDALALQPQLTAWRRDFHMHPELSFQERRTAARVAQELAALGLRVETGIGKTGVVGHLGAGSPVIGIRADMDALPIQEENDVPYASQTPGAMHACGHDAHTAILLGAARLLSQMEARPAGQIRFLFQPSEEDWDEETKSGAVRMIEDGVLEGLDAVIALHVDDQLESGKIGIAEGHVSAAVDSFHGALTGQGCHGAYPHNGVDPFFILAQVIPAIHGIRARRINPLHPVVVSIGSIHGGTTTNVIPARVEIAGTIRSFDEQTRAKVWAELEKAFAVSRALGGDYELLFRKGYPSLYNAPEIVAVMGAVVREKIGPEQLENSEPGMGAEDFSYLTQQIPGAMCFLGVKRLGEYRPVHSPIFDLDEGALPLGVIALAETACRLLENPPAPLSG